MKNIIFIITCFIFYVSPVVSAQYANVQVKEGFDKAMKWYTEDYYSSAINNTHILDDDDDDVEPQRLQSYTAASNLLRAHITTYRTTRDKAYLIKAINIGLDLISKRYDYLFNAQTDHKTWSDFTEDEVGGYWYDGFMAAALAELAYIMIQHPDYSSELINQTPPAQLIIDHLPAQYYPYVPTPLTTYGALGSWFRDRVNESLTYHWTNYWRDDEGFLYLKLDGGDIKTLSEQCDGFTYYGGLTGVNQHSPLTVAAMYLAAIDPSTPLKTIPQKIAYFYFKYIPIYKDDDCNPLDINIGVDAECELFQVMQLNQPYNAYWWFDNGWSNFGEGNSIHSRSSCKDEPLGGKCRRECSDLTKYVEDFGHADYMMEFPIHAIPFLGQYFNQDEMIRWKNTFTKLIWDPYHPEGPGFHTLVNGTDTYNGTDSECCNGDFNCPCFFSIPLMFAPLSKFDYDFDPSDPQGIYPKVYNIVMDYYEDVMEPAIITNYWRMGSRPIYGQARTTAAQWDKECTNNTLYNRDVVYDQDFFAKNILTIAPRQTTDVFYTKDNSGNPSPFADPETFTDGGPKDRFIIESGTTVNMTAGERIVVKSGSSAKLGSKFHAYIDPDLAIGCPLRIGHTQNTTESNPVVLQNAVSHGKNKIEKETLISNGGNFISPNPTTGIFTLQLKENAQAEILIYNPLGQVVYQSAHPHIRTSTNLQIDLSTHPRGIYFIKVQSGENVYTEKVVVQ